MTTTMMTTKKQQQKQQKSPQRLVLNGFGNILTSHALSVNLSFLFTGAETLLV